MLHRIVKMFVTSPTNNTIHPQTHGATVYFIKLRALSRCSLPPPPQLKRILHRNECHLRNGARGTRKCLLKCICLSRSAMRTGDTMLQIIWTRQREVQAASHFPVASRMPTHNSTTYGRAWLRKRVAVSECRRYTYVTLRWIG